TKPTKPAQPTAKPAEKPSEPSQPASKPPEKPSEPTAKPAEKPNNSTVKAAAQPIPCQTRAYGIFKLDRNWGAAPVSDTTQFRTGDRSLLRVIANTPGVLDVYTVGSGTREKVDSIPLMGPGGKLVPGGSYFEFAGPAGEETIELVLNPCKQVKAVTEALI